MQLRPRTLAVAAVIYSVLLPVALLLVYRDDRTFPTVLSAYFGAAMLVAVFGALADVRPALRVSVSVGLLAYVLTLSILAFVAAQMSLDDADVWLATWFWLTTIVMAAGFLLPIRLYVGSIGWPRDKQATKPSLAGVLCTLGYFCLVPLPSAAAMPDENGLGTIVMALCLTAVSAGPAMVLLCAKPWIRVLAAVPCLLTYIMWGMAASDNATMDMGVAVFTPLVASFAARWCGLRIRR